LFSNVDEAPLIIMPYRRNGTRIVCNYRTLDSNYEIQIPRIALNSLNPLNPLKTIIAIICVRLCYVFMYGFFFSFPRFAQLSFNK